MENQLNEKQTALQTPKEEPKKEKKEKPSILTKKYLTPVGNKMQPEYELQYDEKLRKDLVVKVGEVDIDDQIQKSAHMTDFAFLQREAIRTGQYPTGDENSYGVDMTLLPSNIHELHKFSQDYKAAYDRLGEHGKKAFGSVQGYKDAILNGSAETILNNYFLKLSKEEIEKAKPKKQEKEGDK